MQSTNDNRWQWQWHDFGRFTCMLMRCFAYCQGWFILKVTNKLMYCFFVKVLIHLELEKWEKQFWCIQSKLLHSEIVWALDTSIYFWPLFSAAGRQNDRVASIWLIGKFPTSGFSLVPVYRLDWDVSVMYFFSSFTFSPLCHLFQCQRAHRWVIVVSFEWIHYISTAFSAVVVVLSIFDQLVFKLCTHCTASVHCRVCQTITNFVFFKVAKSSVNVSHLSLSLSLSFSLF